MKDKLNKLKCDWLNGKVPFCGFSSHRECVEPLDGMKTGVELFKELIQSYEDGTDRILAKIDAVIDCFDK